MMDPAAFAEARLDEDEAAVRYATPGPWHIPERDPLFYCVDSPDGSGRICTFGDRKASDDVHNSLHIIRHDPARALREVEAGRRILARHWNCGTGGGWCDEPGLTRGSPCPDMTDLLTRWADHPAYDQEWKP